MTSNNEHFFHISLDYLYIFGEMAALFTIAKMQKQSECLSTDEWIKKNEVYNGDI